MGFWEIIIAIAAGLTTILNAISLIYNNGKLPFIKAMNHKKKHEELETNVGYIKTKMEEDEDKADSDNEELKEHISKQLDQLRGEFNRLLQAYEKRIEILDTTFQQSCKINEKAHYMILRNDVVIMDALVKGNLDNNDDVDKQMKQTIEYIVKKATNQEDSK